MLVCLPPRFDSFERESVFVLLELSFEVLFNLVQFVFRFRVLVLLATDRFRLNFFLFAHE